MGTAKKKYIILAKYAREAVRLFVNSSFLIGAGSIFNLGGNYFDFNTSDSPDEADFEALKSDWEAIGFDMEAGLKQFEENY